MSTVNCHRPRGGVISCRRPSYLYLTILAYACIMRRYKDCLVSLHVPWTSVLTRSTHVPTHIVPRVGSKCCSHRARRITWSQGVWDAVTHPQTNTWDRPVISWLHLSVSRRHHALHQMTVTPLHKLAARFTDQTAYPPVAYCRIPKEIMRVFGLFHV